MRGCIGMAALGGMPDVNISPPAGSSGGAVLVTCCALAKDWALRREAREASTTAW
jgi:hypothetical protein